MKPDNTLYADEKLLHAVREDGTAGWEQLCSEFDPLIRSITNWSKWRFSEHEQQDVRQNIYVHLQTALPSFRQECSLAWFIKKIAINKCVDEVRRQVRWRKVMTPISQKNDREIQVENGNIQDPLDAVILKERRQLLRSAMQHMGATCKDSINLFYMEHYSYRQISERLGISVNTVGSRLAKCLDKLHKELKQMPEFQRSKS